MKNDFKVGDLVMFDGESDRCKRYIKSHLEDFDLAIFVRDRIEDGAVFTVMELVDGCDIAISDPTGVWDSGFFKSATALDLVNYKIRKAKGRDNGRRV